MERYEEALLESGLQEQHSAQIEFAVGKADSG